MTKKCLYVVVLISVLACCSAATSAIPLNNINIVDTPQEISGAVGLFLPLAAQSNRETRKLIRVVTDQTSGCGDIMSGETTVSGSYTVVQQLGTTAAKQSGNYIWSHHSGTIRAATSKMQLKSTREPQSDDGLFSDDRLFSYRFDGRIPQSATRYILCILHENATGQDKFTNVHLVPGDWQNDVLPAISYLRAHKNFPKMSQTQVRSLSHESNPYLVLTSLQLLASSKSLTPADMEIAFAFPDTKVVACSLVVAHLCLWSDVPSNAQWLKTKVSAIQAINQLEGVAYGLFVIAPYIRVMYPSSADDFPNVLKLPAQQEAEVTKQEATDTDLLPLVRQKLTELDPNGDPADERWRNIHYICRQDEMMQKYLPKAQTLPDAGKQP